MENEVSGIAKLGIVLIALAVLIGLGFGIFQISKSAANSGVNDVQKELDNVSKSNFSAYDQTTITGTSVKSALNSYNGSPVAVLVATQSWINLQGKLAKGATWPKQDDASSTGGESLRGIGAGFTEAYGDSEIPIVTGRATDKTTGEIKMTETAIQVASNKNKVPASWVNYNAVIGNRSKDAPGVWTDSKVKFSSYNCEVAMAAIYFDTNCYRCTSGFATDENGQTIYNNVTGNIDKTGKTEYIPNGAKFSCFLIKDMTGTNMGFVATQTNG